MQLNWIKNSVNMIEAWFKSVITVSVHSSYWNRLYIIYLISFNFHLFTANLKIKQSMWLKTIVYQKQKFINLTTLSSLVTL